MKKSEAINQGLRVVKPTIYKSETKEKEHHFYNDLPGWDTKEKFVWLALQLGWSHSKIAKGLKISKRTVTRIKKQFIANGDL